MSSFQLNSGKGMDKVIDKLFVYGTLRQGFDHPLMEYISNSTTRLGYASVLGHLYMIGPYPGMVIDSQTYKRVLGEILHLEQKPEDILSRIDEYEECSARYPEPHEYRREIIHVTNSATNESLSAWAYLYKASTEGLKASRSGDFLREINSHH